MDSEAELIRDLKIREIKAYEYIYNKYSGAINDLLIQIAGFEHNELLLIKTFETIYTSIEHYDENEYRLFTWMVNIARHLALNQGNISSFKINTDLNREASWAKLDTAAFILAYRGYTNIKIAQTLRIPVEEVGAKIREAGLIMRKSQELQTGDFEVSSYSTEKNRY
ncbi:MAG: hypothetical protein P0Y49_13835 [Candidatus Pedobacter colombiensis]|uniref:Sigma-70 family RNA polymerase sigma factor n=1 Tax=Candidatus Pedobacter colombiensis TaxID=3121371 RepID=A0AAJ6B572_9SPHI|nr:hypothetical protein [Pedobacter sp.]WEK17880.1 MAG: hypothetical protein P0Y49_13835 [Pedobacter sp.]